MAYNISENGLNLIKKFEGFSSKPYLDVVKKPTIGYGNTFYGGGRAVTMKDSPISEHDATLLLLYVVKGFVDKVNKLIGSAILNQSQFDALVCFSYNVGLHNLENSTLLRKVKANPNDPSIKDEFLKWNKAGGKVLQGLVTRRKAEAELYLSWYFLK